MFAVTFRGGLLKSFATALVALGLVFGLTPTAHATPVTGTIDAELGLTEYKDIVVAGTKLFVLNGSNIKVIDTSVNPRTVATITFEDPALDGVLARGVYVATDQSVWVTSYRMGPDVVTGSVTAKDGGEVIRIDARTNVVTDRFCALSGSGNCTSSPNLEAATGITTDGQKVYVAMQAFDDTRDSILVFDIGNMPGTPPSRLANLTYTVVNGQTDAPAFLAMAGSGTGKVLYVIQDATGYTRVVRIPLADPNTQNVIDTGIANQFAATGPDGFAYIGRSGILARLDASGSLPPPRLKDVGGLGINGVAFSPQGHADGEWVFRAQTTGAVVAQLRSATPFNDVGSVTGLSNVTGIAVLGDYLYVATAPTVTQISLNPTVATANRVLTLDTPSTIDAPTIQYFWNTVSYESTSLPAGLTINPSTGVISGTPTVAGRTTVTVTARNSTMFTRTSTFTITVVDPNAPPPTSARSGGPPAPVAAPAELAATGTSANALGGLSLSLFVAGIALWLIARRRAGDAESPRA